MVKIEIKKKTLNKMDELFKKEKLEKIETREGILKQMDITMKECLVGEEKARRNRIYSEAKINENYFFALFYLREQVLGKDLNVHKERKRILGVRKK